MIPRLSIITPSFNQGQYLEDCIRSVLEQNYPNLEYIIMDGGSSDQSVEIIQKYAGRLAYWVSQKDAGQSDAINQGFTRASGDLVAWLNADDFYLPGALQAAAQAYQENPNAAFYFGNGLRVDERKQRLGQFFPEGEVRWSQPALLFGLNYILQPAAFINRAALAQAGMLDTSLHYGMDSDLWLRLAQVAEPMALQSTLAAQREYSSTKSKAGSFARIEELRALAEKHSGAPMTPGVLCYFLDTLYRYAEAREDLFTPEFRQAILIFWAEAGNQMARFGARPDGSPLPADAHPTPTPAQPHHSLVQRAVGRLRRKVKSL